MKQRTKRLADACRNRGGDCPCTVLCQAKSAVEDEIAAAKRERANIAAELERLECTAKRLRTPPATLKEDYEFDPNREPVMVFDGEDATFGYEDESGEWTDAPWPFNEDWVWPDDCQRFGIRVE